MGQPGTIADAVADREAARRHRLSLMAHPELRQCDRRCVCGEVRYYDTTDQYAIVSRQGRVLWFAVRPDGDVRI